MKKHQSILLIFVLGLFLNSFVLSQSPKLDLNWETIWVEEFNGNTLSQNWIKANNAIHSPEPQLYLNSNVSISNGKLNILTNNNPTICPQNPAQTVYSCGLCIPNQVYNYTSGWIETSNLKKFKYGYFETEIEFPNGNGLWPAFWTWQNNNNSPQNYTGANEIDIFEALINTNQPSSIGSNVHLEYCTTAVMNCDPSAYLSPICPLENPSIQCYSQNYQNIDFSQLHKFGMEWNSSKISWYLNDKLVRVLNNPGVHDSVRIIFNTAIFPANMPSMAIPFSSTTKVSYFKYYKLKKSCQTIFNSCSISSFDFKIYDQILIGGANCQNTLNNYDNYVFRSLNGLTFNGDFTVPIGISLEAKIQNCNE